MLLIVAGALAQPGRAQFELEISECPGDQYFDGDMCWKKLRSDTEGTFVIDLVREDSYGGGKALGLMSQNFDGQGGGQHNDDMVGLGCTVETTGNLIRGRLTKDWYGAEPGVSECTFLYISRLWATECPYIWDGYMGSPMCWLTMSLETEGERTETFPVAKAHRRVFGTQPRQDHPAETGSTRSPASSSWRTPRIAGPRCFSVASTLGDQNSRLSVLNAPGGAR